MKAIGTLDVCDHSVTFEFKGLGSRLKAAVMILFTGRIVARRTP